MTSSKPCCRSATCRRSTRWSRSAQVQRQQPWFPTNLLHCPNCELVQLGLAVDPVIIFPPEYPYTSGMTRILRDNFAELYAESSKMLGLGKDDLVVDIGSNDGTLISNFQKGGHRILGIEPTDVVQDRQRARHPDHPALFLQGGRRARSRTKHGAAKVVTAANCFAHIEDVHAIVEGIMEMLAPDGVFISESHYLIGLLDTLQYDTVYHEHLRHYSVGSLAHLLEHARARSVSRAQDPDPWRLDPRLCGAQGHAAGAAQRQGRCSTPSRAATPCASASPRSATT